MPSRWGRRGVVGVVLVLLLVAGLGAWLLTRQPGAAAAQTVTVTVGTGSFQDTVSATGALAPRKQADLDFAVSGRVTQVKVAAGDQVEKGDVLARLERASLEASLDAAEAQLEAARAQYDDGVDAGASSTQLAADNAAVAAAASSLSQAQDDLDAATLTATMTGTVASVALTVGDQVSGGSQSSGSSAGPSTGSSAGSGNSPVAGGTSAGSSSSTAATTTTTAVVIVSPKLFTVEADVSADDVTSVKQGMQAEVTPSGTTEAVFGTVTSVGLVAETSSSGAATFPVTVSITGPQAKLYAGTSATVSIITKQVTDVLSVPTLALHTKGATTYVRRLVDGAKVKTDVKLGATYGASTEVLSGLETGDKVVLTTLQIPAGGTGRTGGNQGGFPGGDLPSGGFPGGGAPPGAPPGGGFGGTP